MDDSAEKTASRGQGGELLLPEGHRIPSDIKLVQRAIREGWPVTAEVKAVVVKRMREIVEKREVTVMTKAGLATLDGPADSNATAAARAMVMMDGINQADDHLAEKNHRIDEGKATEAVNHNHNHTLDYDDLRRKLTAAGGGRLADRSTLPDHSRNG